MSANKTAAAHGVYETRVARKSTWNGTPRRLQSARIGLGDTFSGMRVALADAPAQRPELKDAKGTAIELWKGWVTVKLDCSGEILKRRAHTLVTAPPVGWVPGQECASPKKRKKPSTPKKEPAAAVPGGMGGVSA